jgi:hypothetical protein
MLDVPLPHPNLEPCQIVNEEAVPIPADIDGAQLAKALAVVGTANLTQLDTQLMHCLD